MVDAGTLSGREGAEPRGAGAAGAAAGGAALRPLFVFGCPRSGTTYLGALLNAHPRVLVSNELRVMDFIRATLDGPAREPHHLINAELKGPYLRSYKRALAQGLREFYWEQLRARIDATGAREEFEPPLADEPLVAGDKTPGHADPLWSPGALDLTEEMFPDARYIHIVRRPRAVVASLLRKGWNSLEDACAIWARIVRSGREFGARVGGERYLEVSYEELIAQPEAGAERIFSFLGLGVRPGVLEFIRSGGEVSEPESGREERARGAALDARTDEQIGERFGPPGAGADAALAHYARFRAARDAADLVAWVEPKPGGSVAAFVRDVPPERVRGRPDVTVARVRVEVLDDAGQPTPLAPGARVRVRLALRAARTVERADLLLLVHKEDEAPVIEASATASGLGTLRLECGFPEVTAELRWPALPPGERWLTVIVREQGAAGRDRLDSWADRCAPLVQRSGPRADAADADTTPAHLHRLLSVRVEDGCWG